MQIIVNLIPSIPSGNNIIKYINIIQNKSRNSYENNNNNNLSNNESDVPQI